jgi:hypothetical protein
MRACEHHEHGIDKLYALGRTRIAYLDVARCTPSLEKKLDDITLTILDRHGASTDLFSCGGSPPYSG